jgi:hypothetical protein
MEEEYIGIRNLDTGIGSAGVGFVVVPSDIDREQYINDCYRTNTLTINGGKGYGYFSGVHADINVMQNITFPTDEENRGTAVVWVKDAISQLPVIVGVLRKQNEYYSLAENQFRLKRQNGDKTKFVELFIDGDESCFDIVLVGDEETPAELNVKLGSKNKDSILNISSDNELNISSEKKVKIGTNQKIEVEISDKGETKTSIVYELGLGLVYKDEFENEITCKDGQVDVISKKINHNSGKEPMVLGNTLADLLDEMLKAIQAITVISPVGATSTPVNAASFAAIQAKLDTIKSKISNLE